MKFRPPARLLWYLAAAAGVLTGVSLLSRAGDTNYDPTALALEEIAKHKVQTARLAAMGWLVGRNNTPDGKNIPIKWSAEEKQNVLWTAKLGSQTYGNPVIANGKVFVGTNNGNGYVKRYPGRDRPGLPAVL